MSALPPKAGFLTEVIDGNGCPLRPHPCVDGLARTAPAPRSPSRRDHQTGGAISALLRCVADTHRADRAQGHRHRAISIRQVPAALVNVELDEALVAHLKELLLQLLQGARRVDHHQYRIQLAGLV